MKHLTHYRLFEEEQFFDHRATDIKSDFDMINDKLFNGEIHSVPLKWMHTKYKLGIMAYNEQGDIEYIAISHFYKLTRQKYLDVLAHEMIHAYMEQKGMTEKDPHGSKFMSIANDINKRFPEFNIVKSNDAADYKAGTGKVKMYGVVLFDLDGELSVVSVDAKVVDNTAAVDEFVSSLTKYVSSPMNVFSRNKSVTIEVYKSDHTDISAFKTKKALSLRSMELFVINDNLAADIRKETPIKKIKIK